MLRSARFSAPVVTAILVVACGSSNESNFSSDLNAGSSGASSGASSSGSGNALFGSDAGRSDGGSQGTDPKCATSSAAAQLARANLIVMYDRSGSMGAPGEGDPNLKWIPVGAAMKDFFASAASNGLSASMAFFGADLSGSLTLAQAQALDCTTAAFKKPVVPLQPLPSAAFAATIEGIQPLGGTPTKAALDGAIAFAKDTALARPTEKAVVVLVTDGLPGVPVSTGGPFFELCSNNTVADVTASALAARTGTPSILTYVIGIGTASSLDAIATAGGTTQIPVDVGNAATTKSKLTAALASIRGQSIPCELALPSPPDGKKMNIDTVNVVLTSAGAESTLPYNKDCTGEGGWHYDNVTAPSKVILCTNACTSAKSASNIQITFGCGTLGGVTR